MCLQTGGGHKSLKSRVSPLNPLNRFQSGFISFTFVVLNECEGPHCRTLQNFLITCQKKRFFASAQNDEKLRRVKLLPRLWEADFCTDDAATLLVRLARIANVLSLWLKSEPVRAWKKSKTGWDGEWFISPNNSNVISIQSSFTSSGVYAPLHPAPAFLCQQRNAGQSGLLPECVVFCVSKIRRHVYRQQPSRNCRLEFRSLISTNFNSRNVNSLRSNSTFLVVVSISTDCSLHKSRGANYTVVSLTDTSLCIKTNCTHFVKSTQNKDYIIITSPHSSRFTLHQKSFTPEVA